MLIALAARADAAPAGDPIAEAVRYANILTGVDPDEEVAWRAPDDPADQRAGTSSDDEDDDQAGRLDDRDDRDGDDGDDGDDAEARADGLPLEPARERADAGLAEHAGELALLDDEPAGAVAVTSDDAGFAAPAAGAVERYEAGMRRRRSWILGRLDVGLAWRRRLSEPMHATAYVSNEVWLLATWRR